jgi:hypothetical protein
MGGSVARGLPNQGTISSFYGNQNLQKPQGIAGERRSMPGGPLLPRLPRNPLAISGRKMVARSIPRLPHSPTPM